MTTVYFIRHGEVADASLIYGRTEMPLSPNGIQQLRNLGEFLKGRGVLPDAIISSPLRRTKESSLAVGQAYGIQNIEYDDDLLEVDFGPEIVGRPVSFFEEVNNDLFTHEIPGKPKPLETTNQIVERIFRVLGKVRVDYEGRTTFVIGHGDPLSLAFWKLVNPDKDLPTTGQIQKEGLYLQKGTAAGLKFSDTGMLLEYELIKIDNQDLLKEGQIKRPQEKK